MASGWAVDTANSHLLAKNRLMRISHRQCRGRMCAVLRYHMVCLAKALLAQRARKRSAHLPDVGGFERCPQDLHQGANWLPTLRLMISGFARRVSELLWKGNGIFPPVCSCRRIGRGKVKGIPDESLLHLLAQPQQAVADPQLLLAPVL